MLCGLLLTHLTGSDLKGMSLWILTDLERE